MEKSFKRAGTDVTTTCRTAKKLFDICQPLITVVDTGGLGRKIAEEMTNRYGIHFKAPMKNERDANTRLLAGDFRSGRVKVVERDCQPLIRELLTLERDLKTGKERDGQENHCIDTVLYGVREAKHYITENWKERPKPGTVEWEMEMAKQDRERDLAEARERYDDRQSGDLTSMVRSLQ